MQQNDPAQQNEWIYDWNVAAAPLIPPGTRVLLDDETLRDGLQNPSVYDPSIEEKIEILHLMEALQIDSVNIGLPGAGPRAVEHVEALAREIVDKRLKIRPNCAARTIEADIRPIAEISQRVGMAIEAATFLGSSPIRRLVEDWTVDHLERTTEKAVKFAVEHGLPSMYVTEDTIRTDPDTVKRLYSTAIRSGARAIVLCDTVGHATPDGIKNLLKFTRNMLDGMGRSDVGIDWHGHNDRGLGVVNSIFALEYGADRIHGTAMGIGERVGNAALDQIMLNLKLLGELPDHDLTKLVLWCKTASAATRVPIHPQYPLAGSDAFRTATGVHAAAIIKAEKKGDAWLADRIYSGVPAGMFGKEQEIEIGHYSGESNVIYWLKKRGYEPKPELVAAVLGAAKRGNRTLTDDEIVATIKATK